MKRPGFTLIELLVAVGLLAVIALGSFSALARFNSSVSLRAVTETLVSDLRLLQNEAKTVHQTKIFDPAKKVWPAGIMVSGGPINFAASGYPLPGGSGTLTLKDRFGRIRKVIVASTGRIRHE